MYVPGIFPSLQLSTTSQLPSLSEKVIIRWEETTGNRMRAPSSIPSVTVISVDLPGSLNA